MLTLSVGSSPDRLKLKTIKIIFAAFPLNMQHWGVRTKTGWLKIRMMCPIGGTYIPTDCCFSELAL
jgi:hypothetical protein